MPHQRQTTDFIVDHPFAGVWLDMGGGKTLSTLVALQRIRPTGHILVVAPVAIARSTWIDEIEDWQLPIRTKSLIVNDNDKQLSKDKRLEAFAQVFQDPPTMYFINQELLTMPSQGERLLVPMPNATPDSGTDGIAVELLDLLRAAGAMTQEELVIAYRDQQRTGQVATKTAVSAGIKALLSAGLAKRVASSCRGCSGNGCARCQFGLIDQMPIQKMNGKDTIIWPFQTVIVDESQGFKSHTSNRFKALARVRPAITRLIELTGTPAPNGLHDLWSQVYLLDQGQALGANITAFRNKWFTPKMVPGTTTPASWVPNSGAEDAIHNAISHLVMSAQNTSLNLPAVNFNDVHVRLTPDLMQAYKELRRDLVLDVVNEAVHRQAQESYDRWLSTSSDQAAQDIRAHLATLVGDDLATAEVSYRDALLDRFVTDPDQQLISTVVAENAAVLTSKLMQFASGTLYTADPDDPGTAGRYEVIHDAKIEMAEYLIRNNGGSPVLLAYHFKSDKEQLLVRLAKAGIHVEAFDGSRSMVARWNAGSIQVMLVHPASAGHGLNLQHGGHTLIWYTVPFSLEHYLQTNARLHRTGQQHPVTIHRLIAKGTQDERMSSVLLGKKNTQDRLIQAVDIEATLLAEMAEEINDDLNDLWVAGRV